MFQIGNLISEKLVETSNQFLRQIYEKECGKFLKLSCSENCDNRDQLTVLSLFMNYHLDGSIETLSLFANWGERLFSFKGIWLLNFFFF